MNLNNMASTGKLTRPIRVMIVDDSAVMRSIIEKILKVDPQIIITGTASNGLQALQNITGCNPDIVILDIEMPVMDGITALPLLLGKKRNTKVVICSTLSMRGADISLKALSIGATECVLKPNSIDMAQKNSSFHTNLLYTIRSLGEKIVNPGHSGTVPTLKKSLGVPVKPEIVAIGSSTGGPNALMSLMGHLKDLPVPILITQHLPPTFTAMLAKRITEATGLPCHEGKEDMPVLPGNAYIAPGGFHMTVQKKEEKVVVHLNEGPLENFCRPSVDPMLRSVQNVYGAKTLAVILTGMGADGLKACQAVAEAGGQVIAQDEATSIVWGMPGAVANAGICSAVIPIPEIAAWIKKSLGLAQQAGGAC